MGKLKDAYLGPDFETPARNYPGNQLAEVVIRRAQRRSYGYVFGKYLRNLISNGPFTGLDIAIENKNTIAQTIADLNAFYETKEVSSGTSEEHKASYTTYEITNPKTGTKIPVTFWTGNSIWNVIDIDSDVNLLTRGRDNLIRTIVRPGINSKEEVITRIKSKKYNQFFKTKETNVDLANWASDRARTRIYGKDGSVMGNFKEMAKNDAIDAGYRIASRQMTKGVKSGLLLLMKDKGMDGGKLEAVREVLDSEVGDAIISVLMGYGLTYVPQLQGDVRVAKLAEEFRVNGMATAGNLVIDTAMQTFLPIITDALSSLPAVEEAQQLRVSGNTSSEECELEHEEEKEKKQATA